MNNLISLLKMLVAVLPFVMLCLLDVKVNLDKRIRDRQFLMPVIAFVYDIIAIVLSNKVCEWLLKLIKNIPIWLSKISGTLGDIVGNFLDSINWTYGIFILANIVIISVYLIVKKVALKMLAAYFDKNNVSDIDTVNSYMNSDSASEFAKNQSSSLHGKIASCFYEYDAENNIWYIKTSLALARKYLSAFFYAAIIVSTVVLLVCRKYMDDGLIAKPFYPVFGIIILGELLFYIQGLTKGEYKNSVSGEDEDAEKVVNYSILRETLRKLFGDRIGTEDTTINNALVAIRTNDEVYDSFTFDENETVQYFGSFIRTYIEADDERELDQNYAFAARDMLEGKSIVFNNPFYNDLVPYAFYPMHHTLMQHKKALVVLGRHAIENDILQWVTDGLAAVTNIPSLWRVGILGSEESEADVGIITRSDVHNSALHEVNKDFFAQVGYVVVIEPSKLLTTAQIGLNLIIKRCRVHDENIVFCSIDKNCDGLVDSLSHVLMTSLTEVSATNKHFGVNSYMCWDTDNEYLHHRLLPNISRYLGFGTELSFVALKNQVSSVCWYGGEAYPVTDQQWIARQYYYELLKYAGLPTKQDMMDEYFKTSSNFWSARSVKNSYMTVEDESFNMFEIVRNFSTRADEQGFVNVISSEYILKDYMAENGPIFEADPKAIPYIVADYARTSRNVVLRLILMLSTGWLTEEFLKKELSLIGYVDGDAKKQLWKEIIDCYTPSDYMPDIDEAYTQKLDITLSDGSIYSIGIDVIKVTSRYNYKTGFIDTVYSIDDKVFIDNKISELFNAGYISEDEKGNSYYLGAELKGHVFQKYLPGQFFVFDGKYYEMMYLTGDNHVLVRRAADHIFGRPAYRQIRQYTLVNAVDSQRMGAQKDIAGIKISNMHADITVNTPAYLRMQTYKDFETAKVISLNGIPERSYMNKQIIRIDLPGASSDIVYTVTTIMNEVFKSIFAENQAYICAVTGAKPEGYDDENKIKPLTYSIDGDINENSIYIIEDSQLDIGLLVAVERNLKRIFEIVTDYLEWNEEAIELSKNPPPEPEIDISIIPTGDDDSGKKKKGFFARIKDFFKRLFKRKGKDKNKGKKKDKSEKDKEKEEKKKAKEQAKAEKQKAKEEKKKAKQERKKAKKGAQPETPDDNAPVPEIPDSGTAVPETPDDSVSEPMNSDGEETQTTSDNDSAENNDDGAAENADSGEAAINDESDDTAETPDNTDEVAETSDATDDVQSITDGAESSDADSEDADSMNTDVNPENENTDDGEVTEFFSIRPLMRYYRDNDGSDSAHNGEDRTVSDDDPADGFVEPVPDDDPVDESVEPIPNDDPADGSVEPVPNDEPVELTPDEDSSDTKNETSPESLDYARNQLCDSYKELYDLLVENLRNRNFVISPDEGEYVSEDVFKVVNCIHIDHPEFFWLTGVSRVSTSGATGKVISIEFSKGCGISCAPEDIDSIQTQVENGAADIIAQAEVIEGDYEKALFVHETLVDKLSYNHELAAARGKNESDEVSLKSSAYGAFVENTTVCQGYAQAYQYIMKRLGIECTYVCGNVDAGSHAWNLIKLDGEYYYVDVTWDDPTYKNGEDAVKSHCYCFATTEWMNSTHTPGDDISYPECTATACNYYVRSGLYMDSYSYEQAKTCIKNAFDSNIVTEIAFSSVGEYQNGLKALVDDGELHKILSELGYKETRFSYIEHAPVLIFKTGTEGTDGDVITGDDEVSHKPELPKPAFSRALYHERYYLLFGAKEEKSVLKPKSTLDYLLGLGFGDNSLKQARKGTDIAAMIEKTFDPTKPGAHFCDFCATELAGTEYEILADGRERCMQCGRTAVKKEEEFVRIFNEVKRNMESFFGIKFNAAIRVQMVTTKALAKRIGKRFEPTDGFDARTVGVAIKDKTGYSLLIENGTPKVSAMLTIAHELTHIWQYLNWDDSAIVANYGADMRLEVYEGMAKWVEIQYALLINEVAIATREQILTLHRNDEYGRGFVRYLQQYRFSKGSYITKPTPFLYGNKPL